MKLEEFINNNFDINCYVDLYYGVHNDGGELLTSCYGNETSNFEPWYHRDIVYMTTNTTGNGIIVEIA